MPASKWREHNGTLLMVFAGEPSADEWNAQMDFAHAMGPRMKRCLILSDVAMGSEHSREIAELTRKARIEVAVVVTSSQVTRMVVTGIGWFTGAHKAFDMSDADAAFDALHVPNADLHELLRSAHEFAHQLGLGQLARKIAGHKAMATITRSATIG